MSIPKGRSAQRVFRDVIFHQMDELIRLTGWEVIAPNKSRDSEKNNHMLLDIKPVESMAFTVSGDGVKHDWLVQVTVRVKAGEGELECNDQVDLVSDYFPLLTELEAGDKLYKQITAPMAMPALVGDVWYSVPVQFRYQLIN